MPIQPKRILRNIAIATAVIGVVGVAAYATLIPSPLQPPQAVETLAELETYLDDLTGYNADSPPGLSLVVVKDDQIVYQNGFGLADGPRNIPTQADSVYNQWSMVKPMTAVAIFQLIEAGLLNLDDPVEKHLPFFKVTYPSETSEIITVRHLLNHSAGFRNNIPEVFNSIHFDGEPEWNQTELLKLHLPDYAELDYEPGENGMYTNIGYMVLSAIIESVSGKSYQQYMMDHFFRPLQMNLTDWTYPETVGQREAVGAAPSVNLLTLILPFFMDDDKWQKLVREEYNGQLWFNRVYTDQKGPTGPVGPATDTAQFLMAYLNGGELNGQRIVSEATVDLMTEQGRIQMGGTPESSGYSGYDSVYNAYGWFYIEQGNEFFLAHSGGGPGFASNMRIYPEKGLGMVVLANGTNLPSEQIFDLVASLKW